MEGSEKAGNEKIKARWKNFQDLLGLSDDEVRLYRSYEPHRRAMEEAPLFSTHEMEVEVIESSNCIAGYKRGDKFVVDSLGILVKERCPEKLCVGAIFAIKIVVDRMWEAFLNNTTEVLHNTVRCPDVGIAHGGVGEVLMRIRAVPKQKHKG
jgi:uncharacterized repeat protein (TIGR04076 family)